MKARGLISAESDVRITKKGESYLDEYQKVKEFLEEFGFIKREDME